jgi:NAD(P)-dependent dehydrogenase (short-subunit alcohol dehydrogenase family)
MRRRRASPSKRWGDWRCPSPATFGTRPSASAVQQTVERFGSLDILVNNAAFQNHVDAIADVSERQWETTFRTNAFGTFAMTKAALVHMQAGSSDPLQEEEATNYHALPQGSLTRIHGSARRGPLA